MKKEIRKTVILIIIEIAIMLIYHINNGWNLLFHYCNSTFLAGAIILFIGMLAVVSNLGMFDHVSYSMQYVGRNIRGKAQVYEDMVDYVNKKNAKRIKWYKVFLPYVIATAPFIVASLICKAFM